MYKGSIESTFTLPAGYFPQLPETVTAPDTHVSGTMGTGIDGILGRAWRGPYEARVDLEVDTPFPSTEAWKAYCLARGYSVPWRYYETPLHPLARR